MSKTSILVYTAIFVLVFNTLVGFALGNNTVVEGQAEECQNLNGTVNDECLSSQSSIFDWSLTNALSNPVVQFVNGILGFILLVTSIAFIRG